MSRKCCVATKLFSRREFANLVNTPFTRLAQDQSFRVLVRGMPFAGGTPIRDRASPLWALFRIRAGYELTTLRSELGVETCAND